MLVVVPLVLGKNTARMGLTEHENVVEDFSTEAADHSLAVRTYG